MERPFGSDITRSIWGDPQTVLLVYAGAAAEFALNPENHWLFYTGKLPADPLKRFRDTLEYQRKLFFMPASQVAQVAKHIRGIHRQVEQKRSAEQGEARISDRAFFQVFSMLIEYGVRGREYLTRRAMTAKEREDYFGDIRSIAALMEVADFPQDHPAYLALRAKTVAEDLKVNAYTPELVASFRRALGPFRSWVLEQFQARFIEPLLAQRLELKADPLFVLPYRFYPWAHFPFLFDGMIALFFQQKVMLGAERWTTGKELIR